MIPNMNLSEARGNSIEPGAYKIRILGAENDDKGTKYKRVLLKVDIADGERQGYYRQLEEKYNFWGLTASLYYEKNGEPVEAWKFANAIDAIRASNADFEWDDDAENDERNLVGMYVGAVLQRKHYIGNDGAEKTKMLVYRLISLDDLKAGNYKVPDDRYDNGLSPKTNAVPGKVVDTTATVKDTTKTEPEPDGMPEGFKEIKDEDIPF